jgi:ABC-2 type transport system permease protein
VNRALLEIMARALRGRVVRRLRLLRQPRYLVTALAALAYFAFTIGPSLLGWSIRGGRRPSFPAAAAAGPLSLLPLAIALLLAAVITLTWIFASSKPSLRLTEAEIHLLLPAPLPRRKVIEFALWKQQAGILTAALIMSLVRSWGSPAERLARLPYLWAALNLIDLHVKGINLWKARQRELPRAAAAARLAAAFAVAGVFWWMAATGLAAAAGPNPLADPVAAARRLADAWQGPLQHTPFAIALTPLVWIGRAVVGGGTWQGALLLAALLVLHYEWVVRSRVAFEDATLERARRQLERRTRRASVRRLSARARRRQPFALAPLGRPEIAIYWKNLTQRSRMPLVHRAAFMAVPIVAILAASTALGGPTAAAVATSLALTGLIVMAYLPLMAGLVMRQDLRSDLPSFEVLRAWPLSGARLVAAELLAPATSAVQGMLLGCGLIAAAALAAGRAQAAGGALAHRPATLAGLGDISAGGVAAVLGAYLLIAVPVCLLSIGIQNVAALALPGWIGLGPDRRRGAALTGQRLLVFGGHLLTLAVSLLPSGLLAGACIFLHSLSGRPFALWEAPLVAVLAALPLVVEVAILVRAGGALWDRIDPGTEILNPED